MHLRQLSLVIVTALACGPLFAAQGDSPHPAPQPVDLATVERATAVGTVSALNPEKRSFTLVEDGTGKSEPYRAFYAGGHAEEIAAMITKLTVGEHLKVVYTVREGRRALVITEVAK